MAEAPQVDATDDGTLGDDISSLIRAEAVQYGGDIETAIAEDEAQGLESDSGNENSGSEESDDTPLLQNADTDAQGARESTPQPQSGDRRGGRSEVVETPGMDDVLAYLTENNPQAVSVVKGVLGQVSRQGDQNATLRDQVADIRDSLLQFREERDKEAEAAVPDKRQALIDKGWTDQQIQNFEEAADVMGYTKESDLEERRVSDTRDEYATAQEKQGVEDFGEDFGAIKDGEVVLNQDVTADLSRRLEDLESGRGVTNYDLYVLTHFDDIKAAARTAGRAEALAEAKGNGRARTERAPRGTRTVTRTTAGRSEEKIYDSKDWTPNALNDVIEKATRLAQAEIVGGG